MTSPSKNKNWAEKLLTKCDGTCGGNYIGGWMKSTLLSTGSTTTTVNKTTNDAPFWSNVIFKVVLFTACLIPSSQIIYHLGLVALKVWGLFQQVLYAVEAIVESLFAIVVIATVTFALPLYGLIAWECLIPKKKTDAPGTQIMDPIVTMSTPCKKNNKTPRSTSKKTSVDPSKLRRSSRVRTPKKET